MRRWLWLGAGLVVLAAVGGYFVFRSLAPAPPAESQSASGRPGGPPGAKQPTPVVALPASTGEIDVYLTGLGTATPLRTVAVKSRVTGQLMRVLFQEGEIVKEGQLLAEIDPRPFQVMLVQAEGQMARDKALLENARLDLERYRTLFQQDSVPKQQLDTQDSLVRQYEGAVRVDQSQIDNARLQLVYARITAPISGRVGLRQVDPGNMVTGTEPNGLVVIAQLQPISVVFSIPQDNVSAVMKRMQSGDKLPVDAWDREQKAKLATGVLASVDNLVDPTTGTVKLKAEFANADNALFPNQFVNVRMKLDTLRDAIVIPSAAIQRGAQGMFVYVVKSDQTVTVRPVKLGPVDGQRMAVSEGLAPGELVVIDGMDRLREGALVEVTKRPEFKPPPDGQGAGKGMRRGKGDGSGKRGAGASQ
ncbi:MAG TPA: MdtA/MuxA family multidrug efflux RND transporter periplasmic adaptor subunit [Burkholderiales bacterium]|nr:MdtA/MuxA family multidrug efflux RND transporter periplasmic adaptor subunit [Burkholderiales bacterium]